MLMAVDAHLVRMGFSPSAQFVYMGSGRRSKPLPYGWALGHPLNVIHSSFGSGSRPHLTTHSGLVHPLWFVGRNETAPDLLSTIYLSGAHSDIVLRINIVNVEKVDRHAQLHEHRRKGSSR